MTDNLIQHLNKCVRYDRIAVFFWAFIGCGGAIMLVRLRFDRTHSTEHFIILLVLTVVQFAMAFTSLTRLMFIWKIKRLEATDR